MKFKPPRLTPPRIRIALPKFALPKLSVRGWAFKAPWRRKKVAATETTAAEMTADEPNATEPNAAEPMAAEAVAGGEAAEGEARPKKSRKKKLLFAAVGVLALVALGAGGWFFVAPMLGLRAATPPATAEGGEASGENKPGEGGAAAHGDAAAQKAAEQGPPAEPPVPTSEVEAKVRRLQDVEEKVAAGDPTAFVEMPKLIHGLSQDFAAMSPATWSQPRNARALALFLLSGGESGLGRKILAARDPAPAEQGLLKGAVAYLEGVDSRERESLLDLDPRQLDPGLGAQLAFVQSILLAPYDRQRAMAQLDVARLLGPGGLVEEAALRREIGLASDLGDIEKFASLSRQYWMRFRASPYAENFLRQFAVAAARAAQSIGVPQWIQFDEFIEALGLERRKQLFLTMARSAAVAGNDVFADFAARRALGLAAPASPEALRAKLYGAMANIAGPQSHDSAAVLATIDRSALPEGDRPLYDAAVLVAARLYRAPPQDFSTPPQGAGDLAGGEFSKAQSDLAAADASLDAARLSMERKTR